MREKVIKSREYLMNLYKGVYSANSGVGRQALSIIDNTLATLNIQNDQLKEVIEEVREYINHEWFKRGQLGIIDKSFQEWQLKDILQILDKAKDVK